MVSSGRNPRRFAALGKAYQDKDQMHLAIAIYHHGRHRLLVADSQRQVVGYAGSSKFATKSAYNTSVETSIDVARDHVGCGFRSQLYTALFQLLSAEDVHCAYAGMTLPNEASIALHQKFGFRQAGLFREVGRKFDKYWDVAWYEKRKPF